MKKIYYLLLALTIAGCTKTEENYECSTPYVKVYLQPYDNYTCQEAEVLKAELAERFDTLFYGAFEFEVLPNKRLDDSFLNKTRYRADAIINSLTSQCNEHKVVVGLTHKDISIPYKGHADWGVLGLALPSHSYACVASDFRLKSKKRDFWKVVTHEFGHAYFKYNHCDEPGCIMRDAKGHANFSDKDIICQAHLGI